jgi:hypothetical protein
MKQVKVVETGNAKLLESALNKYLSNLQAEGKTVVDVKFQSELKNDDVYYSALIVYED